MPLTNNHNTNPTDSVNPGKFSCASPPKIAQRKPPSLKTVELAPRQCQSQSAYNAPECRAKPESKTTLGSATSLSSTGSLCDQPQLSILFDCDLPSNLLLSPERDRIIIRLFLQHQVHRLHVFWITNPVAHNSNIT